MKSKAPLAMMEQIVMLLVFALAAALCLQAFVKSDQLSKRSEARDQAAVLCQNVAEALRHNGGNQYAALDSALGDFICETSGVTSASFDENWAPARGEDAAYYLDIIGAPVEYPGLMRAATVSIVTASEEPEVLFELTVAWQEEVGAHG